MKLKLWIGFCVLSLAINLPGLNRYQQQDQARQRNQQDARLTAIATRFTASPSVSPTPSISPTATFSPTPRGTVTFTSTVTPSVIRTP